MNAQLLRRLFRAINEGRPARAWVAGEIVDSERKQGHVRLATQLEAVLQESAGAEPPAEPRGLGEVRELRPLSRHQELLVTVTRSEQR